MQDRSIICIFHHSTVTVSRTYKVHIPSINRINLTLPQHCSAMFSIKILKLLKYCFCTFLTAASISADCYIYNLIINFIGLPVSYCLFDNVVDSEFAVTVVVKDLSTVVQPGISDLAASLLTTTNYETKIEKICILGSRQILRFFFCLV